MNEHLLHFIWKFRLYNIAQLHTTEGLPVEVLKVGLHNVHSGADFQNAKVKIGEVLWVGNVEIHINTSDWNKHHHQTDAAYDNVVLHVVYKHDAEIYNSKGEPIPVLELKDRINISTLTRYNELAKRDGTIACAKHIANVPEFTVKAHLDRMLIERLESKVQSINALLAENGTDWENLMFAMIARYLGASVNKEPFYLMAKSLPVNVWAKHADDRMQLEALVFGQAGFLDEKVDNDEYHSKLRKEYMYLKRLHNLQPIENHLWKFLRLRPSNFPTIRLAQLAAMMHYDIKMFSHILEAKDIKAIFNYFDVEVSPYWKEHYYFAKTSDKVNSHIGNDAKNILLINAVAPVLFAYGKYKADEDYCDKALKLLELCKPESNSIITMWKELGIKPTSAYDTQALLQLNNEHCTAFNCLNCSIGHSILK